MMKYKETEYVTNDLKPSGNSINQLREQESANIDLASKEIGQQMDNNTGASNAQE